MDDSMSQQHLDNKNISNIIEAETSGGSFLGSPSPQPNIGWNIDDLNNDGKGKIVNKKQNHNANERDRRKKVNSLYASLRSLIPDSDHKKKLSNPATVSQVVKYIPEIQNEVERLIEKKYALITRKNDRQLQEIDNITVQGMKSETKKSFFVGTIDRLSDGEIAIQISTLKSMNVYFSEVLLHLEKEGLKLLNMSSFQSSDQCRLFHNLHLQKKLSNPATVSQVVKYIPEIQNEVERLIEKKYALITRKNDSQLQEIDNVTVQGMKSETKKSFFVGTIDRLSDGEIAIQISTLKSMNVYFSEVLLHLEKEGLKLLNMSSFQSSDQCRLFHNLHLQMGQGTRAMDLQNLREKLLSFHKNG